MKKFSSDPFIRRGLVGALAALMAAGSILSLYADTNWGENTSPLTLSVIATNTPSAKPDATNDWDDSSKGVHKHVSMDFQTDSALDDLIPIVGIAATFGTPILIVFFVCYFKYRRRRENVALAQEYLNKGLPVPPQLLDDGQAYFKESVSTVSPSRCQSDLRRGFKLAFIGLGITAAFYFAEPHSTTWAWGLIPLIMGLGYLISSWFESRQQARPDDSRTPPAPPRPPL